MHDRIRLCVWTDWLVEDDVNNKPVHILEADLLVYRLASCPHRRCPEASPQTLARETHKVKFIILS